MPRLSKFASMSVTKLIELRDELDEHLGQRRKALETQMGQLENYIDGGRKVAGTGRRNPMAGVKVAPKYRGPKGDTWAGRGVYPRWLAALLKEGHKIEEFAIGGAKLAAASKKVARKSKKPARKVKRRRT
jgi:DNA-binding protein H-NS